MVYFKYLQREMQPFIPNNIGITIYSILVQFLDE